MDDRRIRQRDRGRRRVFELTRLVGSSPRPERSGSRSPPPAPTRASTRASGRACCCRTRGRPLAPVTRALHRVAVRYRRQLKIAPGDDTAAGDDDQPASGDGLGRIVIWSATFRALGTSALVAAVTRRSRLPDALLLVVSELDRIDAALSRFREDSELMQVPGGVPIPPSARSWPRRWARPSMRLRRAAAWSIRRSARRWSSSGTTATTRSWSMAAPSRSRLWCPDGAR